MSKCKFRNVNKSRLDFGYLKNYLKRLNKAFSGDENKLNADEFFKDVLHTAGMRLQRRAEKRTPVDTGQLRKNWKVHEDKVRGWNHTVDVENPVEYATYVEYGHRPNWQGMIKGKKNKQGTKMLKFGNMEMEDGTPAKAWVEGYFMLTKSIDETKSEMGNLVNEKIEKLKREMNL